MKTCDVCKRTDRDAECDFGGISTVWIGTTIDTWRVVLNMEGIPGTAVTHEAPVTCELCVNCLEKVNAAIAAHLQTEFGLMIRK